MASTKQQIAKSINEAEYWNDLQHLSNEVENTLDVFHIYGEIIVLGAKSAAAYSAFNSDPLFWNTQSLSLQTTLFVMLSRLFDSGPDTLNVHRVLNAASEHPEFFSRASLDRRISDRKVDRVYIDRIIADAWVPSGKSDFKYLKKAVSPHAERVTKIYQKIRNLYFGHRVLASKEVILDLFAKTNRLHIAEILDFLHGLVGALTNLYLNGVKPEIRPRSFEVYNDKIRATARSVVRKVAGRELFPKNARM